MQYLYADGEFWHFMVADTFEQYAADAKAVGDAKDWISDGDVCQMTLWNNIPLLVEAPNFVELEIVETRSWCQRRYRERWRETGETLNRRCRARTAFR